MKNALFTLIQIFALWLLRLIGSRQFAVPKYMDTYWSEIEGLVRTEEQEEYPGYFKYRRVFTIMANRYPNLDRRALSKAIQLCSDSISSGVKPATEPPPLHLGDS